MRRSRWQLAITWILLAFSVYVAVFTDPSLPSRLATLMGIAAFLALVLRVGWVIPCIIAGVYVGFMMDPDVKGGTLESQILETVAFICGGAIVGFVVGLGIDVYKDEADSSANEGSRQD